MADRTEFPRASLVEGVRFTAQVAVPNVVQGLFRRRRKAAAVAAVAGTDKLAAGFLAGLKRAHGSGPLWIRVAKDDALLLLGAEAVARVLDGSPDPFASDPEPKKSAMAHFQPDALTISREPQWTPRRHFTEAVLDTGQPVHRLGDRFAAVAVQEGESLPASLDWDAFNEAVRRAARRIILGDSAGGDGELSRMLGELMDKSNPPGSGDDALYARYLHRLRGHLAEPGEGSLAALAPAAPDAPGDVAGQLTHWLFALGDTLAINAYRALAVLACQTQVRARVRAELEGAALDTGAGLGALPLLEGCLHETMRLWPTTPMLSREAVRDVDWGGAEVPAGTQLLIVNTFNHRDPDEVADADLFVPDRWVNGDARGNRLFNHFSSGPQGCPGTALALLVGKAMLAVILRDHELDYESGPLLEAGKPLPYSLDFFSLRFALSPRSA